MHKSLRSLMDAEGWRKAELSRPDPKHYAWAVRAVSPLSRYFRTSIDQADRMPSGGAILVGNHATWGIDSFALLPALYQELGRPIRGLGDKMLFANPLMRRLLHATGAVPGERAFAYELLGRGELCLCYPGGEKDSVKRWWFRHRLQWERRTGFLRIALACGVPIVPVFGIGTDDAFPVIGQERRFYRAMLGSERYDLPIYLSAFGVAATPGPMSLPLPTRFQFEVQEPIEFDLSDADRAAVRRGDPDAEGLVGELHAETWARCQAMLDDLARRKDSPLRMRVAAGIRSALGVGPSGTPHDD